MNKEQKRLSYIILSCALLAGPQMAITPGIARIATEAFPQYSLIVIQSSVMLPCLIAVFTSILGAVLVRSGILSRKAVVVIGLLAYAASGIFILLFHTHFWNLIMAGVLLGFGFGFPVPMMSSIMIDSFEGKSFLRISGLQGSFVGFGGIVMSFCAGLLVTLVWYGGYIMLLPALIICIVIVRFLPHEKAQVQKSGGRFFDISPQVLFYSVFASLLFVMTFAAFPNNFSSHLQTSGFINYSTLAGIGIAVNLVGGALAGLLFSRISAKLGDFTVTLAYFQITVGYILIALFNHSYPVILIGSFLSGCSQCLASPQGIVSISRYTTPANSFFATMLFTCICNGIAGFISAPVYTGITEALAPGDTSFRFVFIAICSLVIGAVFAVLTIIRKRRGYGSQPV